jgi:UDP-glucose 4-epimerase
MTSGTGILWITGAGGFIGQVAARQAATRGYSVWCLDRAKPLRHIGVEDRFLVAPVSAAAFDALAARSGTPCEIVHLAGGSSVGPSFADPAADFSATVGSTLEVLDWVRRNSPASRLVMASSAAVYGARHATPILESRARAPASPYGSHKAIMEDLCAEYLEYFGIDVRVARLFSVYGAGLRKQVLWELCCRIAREPSIELGGTGREMRDFIHVEDAAAALLQLASPVQVQRITNIATGIATPIAELTALIRKSWIDVRESCPEIAFSNVIRPGDPDYLVADIMSYRALGLKPTVAIETGARDYVRWFLAEVVQDVA